MRARGVIAAAILTVTAVCMVGVALADRTTASQQVAVEDYGLAIPSTTSIETLQYMR